MPNTQRIPEFGMRHCRLQIDLHCGVRNVESHTTAYECTRVPSEGGMANSECGMTHDQFRIADVEFRIDRRRKTIPCWETRMLGGDT